jgi:hypothetical protein
VTEVSPIGLARLSFDWFSRPTLVHWISTVKLDDKGHRQAGREQTGAHQRDP